MDSLIVQSFSPRAEITIYTTQGDVITSDELLSSAVTLQVVRSIDGNAGQFVLELLASLKNGHSWLDRIHAMDYITIKLGNKNDLHMRMRGFVDSVSETLTMSTSGAPQRRITVTGRDYTKLLIEMNLQYLWQTMITDSSSGSVLGLNMNFGIPAAGTMSVEAVVNLLISTILNGDTAKNAYAFIPNFNRISKVSVSRLGGSFAVPAQYLIWLMAIQPYTGPFWNLITYYASAPIGEVFISDTDNGPIIVCRVAPFKDTNGNYTNLSQAPYLPDIIIDPSVVSVYNLGRLDDQVLNYFFAYPDSNANDGSPIAAYASPGITGNLFNTNFNKQSSISSNPSWISESVDLYGFRPLNIVTPWLTLAGAFEPGAFGQGDNMVALASGLSSFAASVFGHNQDLLSGTLMCHGSAELIPGRYAKFGSATYYIERVSETFDFIGSSSLTWKAVLTVTRGQ